MARLSNTILPVAAAMMVLTANHAAGAQTPQERDVDYFLDDSPSVIALYPGAGYRSYVAPKYDVPSLEELERRVSQLPQGTKLLWTPSRRDHSGKPILFSNGQYDRFAKFCRHHKIELIISPTRAGDSRSP